MSHHVPFEVLVFSKTLGYRHECIPTAINALHKIGQRTGSFTVHASENAEEVLTNLVLQKFSVVVLLHCTGDFLSPEQLQALKRHLQAGRGLVAIHGAAAGLLKHQWYGKLIGAHFDMHPDPEEGHVIVEKNNADHEILQGCGGRDDWKDEWYNFTSHPRENGNLQILLKGDPLSFQGGKHGADHPLSWYQEFEGGRVYYTALGHFDEAYEDEWFMGQIERGILWAARQ